MEGTEDFHWETWKKQNGNINLIYQYAKQQYEAICNAITVVRTPILFG